MDKEDVVHLYSVTLLSHKKEQNWIICRDVDGPREWHTEWNKSERENKYCILMHICRIWKNNINDLNCKAEIEKKFMDTKQEGEMEWAGKVWLTYLHYYV